MCSVYHKGNIVGWLVIWLEEAAAGGRKNFFLGGGAKLSQKFPRIFLEISRGKQKSREHFSPKVLTKRFFTPFLI